MTIPITWDERVNQIQDAILIHDGFINRQDVAPGASWWVEDGDERIVVLRLACPCGCGDILSLSLWKGLWGDIHWKWDKDLVHPTLTPSIQKINGCKWHGYLTKGIYHD